MCVTTSNEVLATEARALTREIEAGLLAFASAEARDEWASFRGRWSADEPLRDRPAFPEEPFEVHVERMRRFRAILKERSERATVAAA
jgi:hypothetical protein